MKMDKRVVTLVGLIALLSTMLFGGAAPTHQAGPVRATAAPTILGFPAATELEAKTAQAAFNAADKGKPTPGGRGRRLPLACIRPVRAVEFPVPFLLWPAKFTCLPAPTFTY